MHIVAQRKRQETVTETVAAKKLVSFKGSFRRPMHNMVQDQQRRGVLARMQLASDGCEASCASKVPRGRALEGPRSSLGCVATDIEVDSG